jgi:hypothetical protein
VQLARERVAALGLTQVTFEHANALDVDFSDGTVFFLYSPFNGEMLHRALRKLEGIAQRKRIALAAVDLELPNERWLRARETSSPALTLYESAPLKAR